MTGVSHWWPQASMLLTNIHCVWLCSQVELLEIKNRKPGKEEL